MSDEQESQEARKIEFDVEALLLSAVSLFLWLSLLSFDAADPVRPLPGPLASVLHVDAAVYPQNAEIQNWCGWFGALAAQLLIQGFGCGALLVVTGLSVLSVWMFLVQSNYVRAARQIGWFLVIVAATTLVSLLNLATPLSPVIGPGGYLGTITSLWLNEHFAMLGSLILTLAVFLAGLLLSTDYVFVHMFGRMLKGSATVASTAAKATKSRVAIPAPAGLLRRNTAKDATRRANDLVVAGGEAGEDSEVPIRIRGQQLGEAAAERESGSNGSRGLLGAAKAVAGGWFRSTGSVGADVPEEAIESAPSAHTPAHVADEDGYAYPPEDEVEELDEFEDRALSEPLHEEGDPVQLRADLPHTPEPKVKVKPANKKGKQAEREAAADSLAHLDDTKLPIGAEEYVLPGRDLLMESDDIDFEAQAVEVRRKAKILEKTFQDFGFNVRVVEIETGPVIAQYEVELEAGLRLSKITGLADDLAIALRVPSVRIVAPIPGKNTVGIEVPNENRQVVRLGEVIDEQGVKGKQSQIPLYLGKDVSGNSLVADLAKLPHLLIAGRTGTGKSVCLNSIIASILMTKRPDEVRMLMIDPKMVELSGYGRLPHLMHPVVTDMRKAEAILAWAVDKMEERYTLLARAGVRHISSYNELGHEELMDRLQPESAEEASNIPDHLPFIVIVADEMADLMMTAGKEVEQHIIRLAQKSRAVGIHLILATQKPTVDVITGLIKSNLPARISFQVASRTDSRVVLDEMGADKLLGNGDMLFLWPGTSMLLRGQGTYMSDEEINAVVDHCSTGEQNFVNELVNLKIKDESEDEAKPSSLQKRDDLYPAAVDVVVREGRGSCSLLQRALGIGYGRAARLIDYMAEDGVVGQYNGSQAREVMISIADWEAMQEGGSAEETPEPPPKQPSNRIRPHDDEDPQPAPEKGLARQNSETPRIAGSLAQADSRTSNKEVAWEESEEQTAEIEDGEGEEYQDDAENEKGVEYEDAEYDEVEDDDTEYEDDVEYEDA